MQDKNKYDSFSPEDSSSKLDSVICTDLTLMSTENTSTLMTMFKKRDHSRLFLMLVLPEPPPVLESSVSSRVHAMEVLTFHITPRDSQVTPELKLSKLSTREVRRLTIPKELRLTSMPSNTETESWATTLPFTRTNSRKKTPPNSRINSLNGTSA